MAEGGGVRAAVMKWQAKKDYIFKLSREAVKDIGK